MLYFFLQMVQDARPDVEYRISHIAKSINVNFETDDMDFVKELLLKETGCKLLSAFWYFKSPTFLSKVQLSFLSVFCPCHSAFDKGSDRVKTSGPHFFGYSHFGHFSQ